MTPPSRASASRRPLHALSAALLSAALPACDSTLPPLPEAVVVVDTDLPVPLAVSRLRIDLYTEKGAWFESADYARPDPRDWPVSFGVYSDDPTRARRVWVRLRAYPDGHTRDYRGENPHVWGATSEEGVPAENAPRLLLNDKDETPPSEPEPRVTVDRLVQLELEPDTKSHVLLVLHGACLGTSAIFGADRARLVLGEAESCVDTEKTTLPVAVRAARSDEAPPGTSLQGTWLADPPCPPPDAASERVCVPGGATVLGTPDLLSGTEIPTQPVRVFGLHRFFVDRYEVTVGQLRQALAAGFSPPQKPLVNNGPLGPTAPATCTWSHDPQGREDYALNCVSWQTARALCQFRGGDLPTEAQWEHIATVAGHAAKTHYPWGNEEPGCDHAAFGRVVVGGKIGKCVDLGPLPPPRADSARDVSPLGIEALAAGLSEWVLDTPAPYSDPCWAEGPLVDPRCGDPAQVAESHGIRGADYILPEMVFSTIRFSDSATGLFAPVGFRCAYPEAGP